LCLNGRDDQDEANGQQSLKHSNINIRAQFATRNRRGGRP
jgi:hypothetical protein